MLIDYSKLDYSTNTSNYPEKFFIPDIAVEFGKPSHNLDNSRESLAISHLQALLQMKILNSSTINILPHQETVPSDPKVWEDLYLLIIDTSYFERERREKDQLVLKLGISLDGERVEDGITHPAEKIIDDALNSTNKRAVYTWLSELAVDVGCPDMAASVLRCLGRRKLEPLEWRVRVVKDALAVDDVEIRDAAVQAVESWGEMEFCNVLEHHSEVVPWLCNYIEDVINDLREST